MNYRYLKLVSALVLLTSVASSNDGAMVYGAGGLEPLQETDVSMVTEHLTISMANVSVMYTFRNTSIRPRTIEVGFPIPPIHKYEAERLHESNPVAFSLVVEGKPREFETQVTTDDKDLIHILYHWRQTFPVDGPLAVQHRYEPLGGAGWVTYPYREPEEVARIQKWAQNSYCLGPKAIAAMKSPPTGALHANTVRYILKTARTWKGPIKHFTLELKKDHPEELIATCFRGLVQVDPVTFRAVHENFVPDRDLDVMFLRVPPSKPKPEPKADHLR